MEILFIFFFFIKKGNKEFESHRKAHYNEFKMAQLLKSQINDDEDEEDVVINKSNDKTN
jgi:hypothetical protein